jgi:fatty acid desaturase
MYTVVFDGVGVVHLFSFYVVLWCFMFTVVFGGVRVAQLLSLLCCVLVLYVHRTICSSLPNTTVYIKHQSTT